MIAYSIDVTPAWSRRRWEVLCDLIKSIALSGWPLVAEVADGTLSLHFPSIFFVPPSPR
jgi:hypothetical protein